MVALRQDQAQPRTSVQVGAIGHENEPQKRQDDTKKSVGFQEGNGYTQVNNAIFDEMISQISNAAELKIVLYVYRHTEGYHQSEVAISIQEFITGRLSWKSGEPLDRGTGLCERSVKSAIQRAVKDGYIERRQVGNTVYFKLRMQEEAQEEETEHDQDAEGGRECDSKTASRLNDQAATVTGGQPSHLPSRSATRTTSQPQRVQSLHPSNKAKGVQNLHPKGGKTCTPSDKTCTPSGQNLHPQASVTQRQERPQAQPKEKRKTNYYKDREKEKETSLSLSSKSSFSGERRPGGRVQRSGDVPQTSRYAEEPVTEEQRRNIQERLAKLRLEGERCEAAELERIKVYV